MPKGRKKVKQKAKKDSDEWKREIIYMPSDSKSHRRKEIDSSTLSHMDAIAVLLEVGNLLEFDTYTGHPRNKCEIFDFILGRIASVKEIPPFMEPRAVEVVKYMDVIWFNKSKIPEYCFEVEYETRVREGLLRMYQIALRFEKTQFFIVGSQDTYRLFRRKIVEDPFITFKQRCYFRSIKNLVAFHEAVLKFKEARLHFFGTYPVAVETWSI